MNTSTETLGAIDTLPGKAGLTGTGTYLLTGVGDHVGQSGQSCLQLTLEDATGRIIGFVWPECRPHLACPATPVPVAVSGLVQVFQGHAQIKVRTLTPLGVEQVASATALLPRRRCPDIALPGLKRLSELEQSLHDPLSGFLRSVLLDPAIGLPFLRCRASVKHHHAHVGGLLMHSTDMLDQAAELTRKIIPQDAWSPHLAQLGYLLHDLGKLRTVGELRRPHYALVVPHEFATIELLAPHLRWLEQRDLALATALRHLFSYLAAPGKARTTPNHVVAEIVEKLDQLSAASHNQRDIDYLLEGHCRAPSSEPSHRRPAPASPRHHALRAAG